MRVISFSVGPLAMLALVFASIAVLNAFIVVAQRSIELAGGQTDLGEQTLRTSLKLSLAILTRIGLLMAAAALAVNSVGGHSLAATMMTGIDGMAFAHVNTLSMWWSAFIATLVLLMVIHAEHNAGQPAMMAAGRELVQRRIWLAASIVVLTVGYVALGFVQDAIRVVLMDFWLHSPLNQILKNLIYFVFILSFAMLRLWMTLLILTFGLKQSYIRGS
ncbi:hypothetical protein OO17_02325 [Rhodopseudomonas palustris]|uniref:Uncharacterized protein n=2 Tax=Nitrobacteraceae TaxID=41294 RepID=A0A0D7F3Z5_RHOPL|nr:hypothetical protein OO17_02325 [Rhodopseudomonas palustris]